QDNDYWVTLHVFVEGQGSCQVTAEADFTIYIPHQLVELPEAVAGAPIPEYWMGISSYLDLADPVYEVPAIWQRNMSAYNHLTMMINEDGEYFWTVPDPDVNQIGIWGDNADLMGYKAKMNNMLSPICLPIFGPYAGLPQQFTINGQFTFLPVLSNDTVNINDLLGSNVNDVLAIYEWRSGKAWSSEATNPDFTAVTPGKSYLLINKSPAVNFDVTFPETDLNLPIYYNLAIETDFVTSSPWNEVVNTSYPHLIYLNKAVTDQLQVGDVIGAFNADGLCVGFVEFEKKNQDLKVAVMGNNPYSEKAEGLATGEEIYFKLYRRSTDEQIDVSFTFDPNYPSYDGMFMEYGYAVANGMNMSITTVNDIVSVYDIVVFPNPATDLINISSDYNLKKVTLVNSLGQPVYTQEVTGNNYQINVSSYVIGMYFIRIETANGNVITKKIMIK
nr:T9SS type A sorting domain-containing protein [Bacteroidota bacterium]